MSASTTTADRAAGPAAGTDPDVVVQGAGMSGICMAVMLKRAGIESFVVLEQSAGVGGTWWDNSYPGAQCDVPSHLYGFSFAPNPAWTRVFAPSSEIRDYLARCVERFRIAPHLRLSTRVAAAAYDEAAARWTITTERGERLRPRCFVLSLGPLNHPRYPAGLDRFRGTVMHTARWNHQYDFRGKRVAVIGSAASAVQVVPRLAAEAAQLSVFQRTPSWIVPRPDRVYTRLERGLFRIRAVLRALRWLRYWEFELRFAAFKGHGAMHWFLTRMARRHLEDQVADSSLRARLRPSYPIGCKRILLASDFYPALGEGHVELVTQAAAGFTPEGVVSADGALRPFDAIVCATGFETIEPLAGLPIRGRGGLELAAAWRDGAEAYRGVTVAGFPNLFMLLGPNTGTGHTSVLVPIEAQARYVVACIRELAQRGAASLEVRADVMRQHNEALQRRLARTVWASTSCTSWYKTAAGRVLALYPGYITRYVLEMRRPRPADFTFEPAASVLP